MKPLQSYTRLSRSLLGSRFGKNAFKQIFRSTFSLWQTLNSSSSLKRQISKTFQSYIFDLRFFTTSVISLLFVVGITILVIILVQVAQRHDFRSIENYCVFLDKKRFTWYSREASSGQTFTIIVSLQGGRVRMHVYSMIQVLLYTGK